MGNIRLILNHPWFFWVLLALPMLPMLFGLMTGRAPADLLHPSGEFSARFMILALMVTPLRLVFANASWPNWLLRRRRALGVAAFAYALLHTIAYLADTETLASVWAEFFGLGIFLGWLAFAVFMPLALTSNNPAQRALGRWWKILQRLAYLAALLTLVHWIFIHNSLGGALSHFAPLGALQLYRIYRQLNSPGKHYGQTG